MIGVRLQLPQARRKIRLHHAQLLFTAAIFLLCSCIPSFAAAAKGVRMVRLSLVQGDVQIDRNVGQGWEQAIVNMPVLGGARLYAADNSRAELEFEDGSSIRLSGPAQITLVQLSYNAQNTPVTVVQVDSGIVYFDARLRDHDDFRVQGPTGESFAITKPSRLRFNVDQQVASLAVTEGEAVIQGQSIANPQVTAGHSYNYILGQPESAARLDRVPQQPDDQWDAERDAQQQQAQQNAEQAGQPDASDASAADLSAYGAYSDIPGYGMAWQPYGVDDNWSPYDNGAWGYYPDWGWTYISAYPWGWAPFYYGNWCYIGGRGWWWRPGGHGPHGPWGGGGWHAQPSYTGAPGHNWKAPHAPTYASHNTVAVPGSNLRVGSIAQTHGELAMNSAARGPAAGGPMGRVGVDSNLVRGRAVPAAVASPRAASPIVGQKGSYALANGTATAHNGFEVHRPATGFSPRSGFVNGSASSIPRPYSSVPRPAMMPHYAPYAGAAPHISAPPHIASGAPAGGGFHSSAPAGGAFHGGGGGFSGGGGAHVGGGGHR